MGQAAGIGNASVPLAVAAGGSMTCAVLSNGTVACWGEGAIGQLGSRALLGGSLRPAMVSNLGDVTAIATMCTHVCALISDGIVACWGENSAGEIGTGSGTGPDVCMLSTGLELSCAQTPMQVSGVENATAIGVGCNYSCAALSDGTATCWGGDAPILTAYAGLHDIAAIAGGVSRMCILQGDGVITCQATDGSDNAPTQPVVSGATAVAGGDAFDCAVLGDRSITCWGSNSNGQLGNGTMVDSTAPVAVSNLSQVESIAAGATHACALLDDGTVACWGKGGQGQLGNGSLTDSAISVRVMSLSHVIAIAAGTDHTCTVVSGGTNRVLGRQRLRTAWKRNHHRQLGSRHGDRILSVCFAASGLAKGRR